MKKWMSAALAAILGLSVTACSGGKVPESSGGKDPSSDARITDNRGLSAEEYTVMNTVGTDALGRYFGEAAEKKNGTRYVGIWYSLWLGQHAYMQSAIYDNTKLLSTEEGRAALNSNEDSELSRMGEFHFCAEPLYGYYSMSDPWVVTRHVELLTAAGIDYLCFDTTNAAAYVDVAKLVIETLLKYQKQGFNVPKVMFYTNSNSGTTANLIYTTFYQTEKYDSIWFMPNGKPLIAGVTKDNNFASNMQMEDSEFSDFLDTDKLTPRMEIVESQWPQGLIEHENAIPWMSWKYPQSVHPNYKAISVSVAQHGPTVQFSDCSPESNRGYNYKTGEVEDYRAGRNFANEWQTVFDYESKGTEIRQVMLTGWNEWMAVKSWNGNKGTFCDVYTEEYGRDIEMSAGETGDNFYLQMISNVRQYKLEEGKHYRYQKMTIDSSSADTLFQWEGVKAHYRDFEGDALNRDFVDATGKGRYYDASARNDITDVKVVHNATNLYFYIRTANDITPFNGTDVNWMNILIDTDGKQTGFEGYDFAINRAPKENGKTSVEKSSGGYVWNKEGEADYKVFGNVMVVTVPLSLLGLTADDCYIRFKVCDNVQDPGNIMSYYVTGDSAPIGRLSYSYGY